MVVTANIESPYEAAFIGEFPALLSKHRSLVIGWINAMREKHGGRAMAVIPQKVGGTFEALRPLLPKTIPMESHKGLLRAQVAEIVVVCNPSPEVLERVDRGAGLLRAVLVLPWGSFEEIEAWAVGRQAVDLLGGMKIVPPIEATTGDAVVDVAIRSVVQSVNRSTGLSHPMDKARAVWTLKHLYAGGYRWNPHAIEVVSVANGLWPNHGREFAEISKKVLERRQVRGGADPLPHDVVDLWRKWAAEADDS